MPQRTRTPSIGAGGEAAERNAWPPLDFGELPYCTLRRRQVSSEYRSNPATLPLQQLLGGLFASTVINPLQLAH